MEVCAISDTHTHQLQYVLKDETADLLMHAGDGLNRGSKQDWIGFLRDLEREWESGKFKHIIYVPGNHDHYVEDFPDDARADLAKFGIHLLIDQGIEIGGLKIWGSPYTPTFGDWAFMADRGPIIAKHWKKIPEGLDILITHGPPHGILDLTDGRYNHGIPENVGCEELRSRLDSMNNPPRFCVVGHIHAAYGTAIIGVTKYLNVAVCTEQYRPTNQPMVFDA